MMIFGKIFPDLSWADADRALGYMRKGRGEGG